MLLRGVLEQLGQLQGVLADLLHGREQEAVQGDVDHLLQQAAGLEEVAIPALLHEAGQLRARAGVVVAVLRVDAEALLLRGKRSPSGPGGSGPGRTCSTRRYVGGAPGREGAVPRPTPPRPTAVFSLPGQGAGVFVGRGHLQTLQGGAVSCEAEGEAAGGPLPGSLLQTRKGVSQVHRAAVTLLAACLLNLPPPGFHPHHPQTP